MPTKQKSPVRDSSINDAADELELSEDTVRRDIRRGCPHSRKGTKIVMNIPEYREWRAEQGLTGERGRPIEGDSPDLERARLRKENALASKYELQVKREKGELVPVAEVQQWIGERNTTAKNKFIGLGASVTPLLEGRDAAERQGIIDARVIEILDELAADR
jgi:hypothetical protein